MSGTCSNRRGRFGRSTCTKREVFDEEHRNKFGYRCLYRHSKYIWPGKFEDKFILISDSICKYVHDLDETRVEAYPGATISDIEELIIQNKININYRIIILHLGSNFLCKYTVEEIRTRLEQLIVAVEDRNPAALIVLSGIIPKLTERHGPPAPGKKRRAVNKQYEIVAKKNGLKFLHTWRVFIDRKSHELLPTLYARDCLHVNWSGAEKLSKFFNISNTKIQISYRRLFTNK